MQRIPRLCHADSHLIEFQYFNIGCGGVLHASVRVVNHVHDTDSEALKALVSHVQSLKWSFRLKRLKEAVTDNVAGIGISKQ